MSIFPAWENYKSNQRGERSDQDRIAMKCQYPYWNRGLLAPNLGSFKSLFSYSEHIYLLTIPNARRNEALRQAKHIFLEQDPTHCYFREKHITSICWCRAIINRGLDFESLHQFQRWDMDLERLDICKQPCGASQDLCVFFLWSSSLQSCKQQSCRSTWAQSKDQCSHSPHTPKAPHS